MLVLPLKVHVHLVELIVHVDGGDSHHIPGATGKSGSYLLYDLKCSYRSICSQIFFTLLIVIFRRHLVCAIVTRSSDICKIPNVLDSYNNNLLFIHSFHPIKVLC